MSPATYVHASRVDMVDGTKEERVMKKTDKKKKKAKKLQADVFVVSKLDRRQAPESKMLQ